MADELPGSPKTIWQDQTLEVPAMTMERLRQKAREVHAKTRRELFGNTAVALIAVAISGFGILRGPGGWLRLAFVLALAWALAGQFFLHRGMWSVPSPADAGLTTGLEFYRLEIKRRRNLFGRVLRWSFGPVVLSIGALILVLTGFAKSRGISITAVLPFCTAFAVWIIAALVLRARAWRELRRELEDLDTAGRAG